MRNLKMRNVGQNIIRYKLHTRTIKKIMNDFWEIMKEHGICQGEWNKNGIGRVISNPEWTMCKELFLETIKGQLQMELLVSTPPEGVEAYGKRPERRDKL